MRIIERPIIQYLIIGLFSICAAVVLFQLGGSLAEVTGQQDTFLGISFKASGALGGFILICWISIKIFERVKKLEKSVAQGKINMKLYLIGKPDGFDRKDTTYACKYWLFSEESGATQEFSAGHRWEAGYLTLDLREVGPDDMIQVRVENAQKKVWECDFFHSRASKTELPLRAGKKPT